MSWNRNTRGYDDGFGMQEENVRVRLLSMSEDEDAMEERIQIEIPSLNLRNGSRPNPTKSNDEKKSRMAVTSILVIGLVLIITVMIGVAIHLKDNGGVIDTGISNTGHHLFPPVTTNKASKCDTAFPWQYYRLPKTVFPELYKIYFHPNLTSKSFSGYVNITVRVDISTNIIILHSKQLNLSDIQVKSSNGQYVKTKEPNFCKQLNFLVIPLQEKLVVGRKYVIHIKFSGSTKNSLRGFYVSNYTTIAGKNKLIGSTQFEPTDARKAFPCFDEPMFKANFSISLVREEKYNAVSNMPIANIENLSNGLKADHFEPTVRMSTYLVAFIISEFARITETIEVKNGHLNVSVYAPADKIKTAEFALEVACKAIPFYENLFNIPYPLRKLDLAAIPNFEAGAMENWGLVTYRETTVLWDEKTASVGAQEYVALVIAHELAHQWFGNLVTMKWWNDLWLNEGFASFMEYYAVDKMYPDWQFMNGFHGYQTSTAMHTDDSEYTHPITVPVDSSVQIEEVFDSISYSKGACVIMMLVDYLGEHAFLDGVSEYLKKFSYGNAENQDFVFAVSAKINSGKDDYNIPSLIKSWTTQPGFPVLNVSLHGHSLSLAQMRYLSSEKDNSEKKSLRKKQIWQIPVSYLTSLNSTKQWSYFLNESSTLNIAGTPEWVLLNIDRGGYYLVNYDDHLLERIIQQLKKNHSAISAKDREGIIFNAAKMAKLGYLSYNRLFDLISYSVNETEFDPMTLVISIVRDVIGKLEMQFQSNSLKKMKKYGENLFKILYHKYGWPAINETLTTMTHPQIFLRKSIVSAMCAVENLNCTSEALRRFKLWKEENIPIHRDYKSIVYTYGIKLGSKEDWEYVWNKYTGNDTLDAYDKNLLLKALCSTTDQNNVLRILDESLKNSVILEQDVGLVLSALTRTRVGGLLTWSLIKSQWSQLIDRFPLGSSTSQSFLNVFKIFTDDIDVIAAQEFMSENKLSEIRFAQRALDHAKFNVHWINKFQPKLIQWLNKEIPDE